MNKTCFKILVLIGALLLSEVARAQAIPADLAAAVNGFGEEGPAAAAFLEKSTRKGAPRDFTAKVLEEAKGLRNRGLPAEPYLLKASEGLAKGAPPAKIGGALQKTRRQTEEAEILVNRAIERRGLSSTPAEKRGAILNFQRALFLNQTPPRRLEKWIDTKEGSGKSESSLDQIGKAAREFNKTKREKYAPDRGKVLSSPEGRPEKDKNRREPEKKSDREKQEEKSKFRGLQSEKEDHDDSRFKEKGGGSFKKPRESFDRPSSSPPSSHRGSGKNK